MQSCAHRFGDGRCCDDRCHRISVAHSFRHCDNIRNSTVTLKTPEMFASAPKTSLYL
jgi:hypothetical protein